MILSRDFVFIHFPKTGGTFFRYLCEQYAPAEWEIRIMDDHPSVQEIPEAYQHLPVFGMIRNPFDWYVSWYFYLKGRGDNAFFNSVSDNGAKGFKETMLTIFDLDLPRLLDTLCTYENSAYGCYLNHTYGTDLDAVHLGKFENLREDILRILKEITTVPQKLEKQILHHSKVNEGTRRSYREYYDKELMEIVGDRDRDILTEFGYYF